MAILPDSEFSGIRAVVSEWLYSDWDKDKYDTFVKLYSIPVVRNYFDYLLDVRSDKAYMDRYQMDYSDIYDPRKLRQTNSGASLYRSAVNFISSNAKRLYDD